MSALTDLAIRKAAPGDRPRKVADGGGLYLEIRPTGAKWWRLKYRHGGKEKRISLGVYPDVSLAMARARREEARALLAQGVDPSEARKDEKAEQQQRQELAALAAAGKPLPGSFAAVALEWLALVHEPKVSTTYARRSRLQLERDLFPWLGRMTFPEITAPVLLQVLRRVEARGAGYSALRVKQTFGLVCRYAVATGHAERDPSADLRGALVAPVSTHYAAITDPVKVGELLRAIDGYDGMPWVVVALKVAALTFQRPGNVRRMRWEDLELSAGMWAIPSAEMKRTKQQKVRGADHLVPLARQAVELLQDLRPLTGECVYCFPSLRTGDLPISENTLNSALRRLGYGSDEMTAHGFRALARTVIVENLPGIDPQWIEAQLAHAKSGPLGSAYDRAQYLKQRRQMMQAWADYLDTLRRGAEVIPFRAA
ncbi:MAG: hypothetical protein RL654_2560 [Pseudomonadota bacterium]